MVEKIVMLGLMSGAMAGTFPALLNELPRYDIFTAIRFVFFFACLFGLTIALEE